MSYLQMLYKLVVLEKDELDISEKLQLQLLDLQGSVNEGLATLANKTSCIVLTKTHLSTTYGEDVWNRIRALIDNQGQSRTAGYKVWVAWTNNLMKEFGGEIFQDIIQTEEYWKKALQGVTSSLYDEKKYSLHIVTKSLQMITRDISNGFMRWEVDQKEKYISDWKRFSTLVEMITIDTSFNQTKDSVNELFALLSDESAIPSKWAVSLIAAGLSTPLDTIRKFLGNTVLGLDCNHLKIFTYDMDFMLDTFLPFAMMSPHFTDVTLGADGRLHSEHAGKLALFVERFVSVLDDDGTNVFVAGIFKFLYENNYVYDPARVYLMKGLVQALRNRPPILTLDNLELLTKLSKLRTETPLRTRCMFHFFIQLLFCYSQVGSDPASWFKALNAFLINHEELVVPKLTRHIAEFINSNVGLKAGFSSGVDQLNIEFKAEIYMELENAAAEEKSHAHPWLDQLSFQDKCRVILSRLPQGQKYLCTNASDEFIEQLRGKVHDTWLYHCQVAEQLMKFRTVDWGWFSCSFTMEDFEHLASWLRTARLMSSSETASQMGLWTLAMTKLDHVVTADLRQSRELALTELYRTLAHYTRVSDKFDIDLDAVMTAAGEHFETSGAKCQTAICACLEALVTRAETFDAEKLADLLNTMWEAMIDDRLVLTERALHLAFIDTAFSPACLNSESAILQERLEYIAEAIIIQSFGRRSIGPWLAKRMFNANYKPWISRVYASMYTFKQASDHTYKLERVMAEMLDKCLQQEGIDDDSFSTYLDVYGEYEEVSTVYSMAYLADKVPNEGHRDLFMYILTSEKYRESCWLATNADDGEKERAKIFQLLLISEHSLDDDEAVEVLQDRLIPLIDTEPSPIVRVYVEWIMGRILARLFDYVENSVLAKLDNPEAPPRILASMSRIGLMIGRQLRRNVSSEEASEYYRDLLSRIVPLATSNRAVVRHFSVSLLYAVYAEFETMSDEFKAYISDMLYIVKGIAQTVLASGSYKKYRSGDQVVWDLDQDFTLVGICGGVLKRLSSRDIPITSQSTWERYFTNESLMKITIGKEEESSFQAIGANTIADTPTRVNSNYTAQSSQIQTKSGVWTSSLDIATEDERQMRINRGELIVLASLVDKAPNLGGICRLSDVLGAGMLCLNDMHVTSNAQFKNVAVTADKWMPMKEVKIEDIVSFMAAKRREGYTLVGLEQTNNSVQLNNDLKFPKKSLLLLGKEREGIPGDLLAELDFCVEIKQVGVIRSMNIQTATAVVVHAYSSQHC